MIYHDENGFTRKSRACFTDFPEIELLAFFIVILVAIS
jgi:hypothetical protein